MPFRSRARRKHLRARACSNVSDLVSCDYGIRSPPSGLSPRQVPAGRITRSCVHPHRPRPILLRQAGRALRYRPCGNQVLSGNLAPNNSFKPSPLRGLGAKPVHLGRAGLTQALGGIGVPNDSAKDLVSIQLSLREELERSQRDCGATRRAILH